MQANKKYIYFNEKAPIYMLPRSKAPRCKKFGEKPLAPKIILLT